MLRKRIVQGLVLLLFGVILDGLRVTAEAVVISINCPTQTLQSGLDLAEPGDMVVVSGTCNENAVVSNEKRRFFILANPGATLTSPTGAGNEPTLKVRGKGIFIQGFTITGGGVGIHVNRNSNAIITNNTIQSTGGDGIIVDQLAFAVIKSNIIQNNPGNGIVVSENGTARIGFEFPEDAVAQPNTIQGNTKRGIVVSRNSMARITANTIQNNSQDGIFVTGSSQADIAGNTINNNGSGTPNVDALGSGVWVSEGSHVVLGAQQVPGASTLPAGIAAFFTAANTTTVDNKEFGVKCTHNATIDGTRGGTQLSGATTLGSGDGGKTASSTGCQAQYT